MMGIHITTHRNFNRFAVGQVWIKIKSHHQCYLVDTECVANKHVDTGLPVFLQTFLLYCF